MDPRTGASCESRDPAPHRREAERTPRSVASVRTRCSTECLPAPETPRRVDPGHRSWADLLPDILGAVAGRLPLVEDRARMRSVCRAWRAAARLRRRPPPPPPLPLLVLSNFSFSSFCTDGTMTATRRIPLPAEEMAAGDARCVGSFEGWLVGVQRKEGRLAGDGRCFLMNAYSWEVIHLPPPSTDIHPGPSVQLNCAGACSRFLPIINGSGKVYCASAGRYVMSFSKVQLSSSPDSGSKCVVAAISLHMYLPKLALWRPGMTSWCVCDCGCINMLCDIAFYQGKLYIFSKSKATLSLFVFEISEDDSGLMVSHVERCATEELPKAGSPNVCWKIVEWHGKLLLVAKIYSFGANCWQNISKIRVFEVVLSTNPVTFTEINTLDGDCVFISPCSSMSFRACQYGGVKDDLLYFVDAVVSPTRNVPLFDKFVYNMRDGTMAPFAASISDENLQAPNCKPLYPTWLFPSE
ncbi:hypothetical protein ACP70R_007446 [Stipagrostis hirtigluma subsp. patula]